MQRLSWSWSSRTSTSLTTLGWSSFLRTATSRQTRSSGWAMVPVRDLLVRAGAIRPYRPAFWNSFRFDKIFMAQCVSSVSSYASFTMPYEPYEPPCHWLPFLFPSVPSIHLTQVPHTHTSPKKRKKETNRPPISSAVIDTPQGVRLGQVRLGQDVWMTYHIRLGQVRLGYDVWMSYHMRLGQVRLSQVR